MQLRAQGVLPGLVPITWLHELFNCPSCLSLVATSHTNSHQKKCTQSFEPSIVPTSDIIAISDGMWELPTFEEICKHQCQTLHRIPAFAAVLSSALRSVLYDNTEEQTKIKKYSYITSHAYHSFTPVAFETTGVCGPRSMSFLTDLGRRIVNTTGEKSSLAYLLQKFSVAIQRGNAASVLGTLPPTLSPPLNNGV